MAKRGKTLREYSKELPTKEDEIRFRNAMCAPSDLVAVLWLAIELEHIVEQSILRRLPRNEDHDINLLTKDNAPLATLFSKNILAYAMGIYDKEVLEYVKYCEEDT